MKVTILNPPAPPTVELSTLKPGDAFKITSCEDDIYIVTNEELRQASYTGSIRCFNLMCSFVSYFTEDSSVIPLPNLELVIKL